MSSETVAIIPVRGGSCGLVGKNMRLLSGKPLLCHTVEAALAAREIDHVVVTTDSEQIASYARSLGAESLVHPEQLSSDTAATFPVIEAAVRRLEEDGRCFEWCVVLRATTPMRTADDIDEAFTILRKHPGADSLVSVVELAGAHPKRLKTIRGGWLVDAFDKEGPAPVRRQELEPVYIRNGGIYIVRTAHVKSGMLWGENCLPFVMAPERSVNINSEYDFRLARWLMDHSEHGESRTKPVLRARG